MSRRVCRCFFPICVLPLIVAGCGHHKVNQPPTTSAGADQVVKAGDSVTLDASASGDPDGDPITFSWSQTLGTPVSLSSASGAKVTFKAPGNGTTLVFKVTVSDGQSNSVATVHVSVHPTGQTAKVVEIRQRSIMDDPAVSGALLNGWAPTPIPGTPPANSWGNQPVAPIVQKDLSPGASGTVDLQVRDPSLLLGSARWIGTVRPLNVTLSLDGATLATGKPYHFGADRGVAVLKAKTTAGGHATLSVNNTSGVRVKVRIALAAGNLRKE